MIRVLMLLLGMGFASAQNVVEKPEQPELLTLKDAVAQALENNFDIRIVKNDLRIVQANVTWGNAAALPSINATITDNNSLTNSSQVRTDGTRTDLDNARNNSLNYGVSLGWTIFDGLGMFARYDRLEEYQRLGEAEVQEMVLDRVAQVVSSYLDLVQQQQNLAALDTTLAISDQRVELAHNRYTIGKASKLEWLNAQVDQNTDRTNLARAKEAIANAKILLNELLARDTKLAFRVADEMRADETLQLPALEELASKQNPTLQRFLVSRRIAELDLKVIKAQRYPVVGVTTGYNFQETQSSLGFTQSTSARGLNYGFNATFPIFNGFNQNRLEKTSKIAIETAKLQVEQQQLALMSQLGTAYQTYLTNVGLIALESRNEDLARENLDITMEKYRIGTITTVEYRTAQLNFLNARVRHSQAKYNAKVSEVSLRQLAGNLEL